MLKPKICAIIVAGGKGKRMGGNIPKQFIKINNIPIIIRTLLPFEKSGEINDIILILPKKWKKKGENLIRKFCIKKVAKIVNAGRTRQASVYNGLIAARRYNPDFALIHDGVRPFISKKLIKATCEGAKKYGAVSTAVTLRDTVFNKKKRRIINRKDIIRIQTPQTFSFSLILNAHTQARKKKSWDFPDDTTLLLSYGRKTVFIAGDERNIKITDKADLRLACSIAQSFGGRTFSTDTLM